MNTWRGTQAATNGTTFPHTTFDRPYLTSVAVRNSGKDTKRTSFGLEPSPDLRRSARHGLLPTGILRDPYRTRLPQSGWIRLYPC